MALAAEYALAIHKDQVQLAVSQGHIEMGRGLLAAVLANALPDDVSDDDRDAALTAVLATAVGLALGRTLGTIDEQQYVVLLTGRCGFGLPICAGPRTSLANSDYIAGIGDPALLATRNRVATFSPSAIASPFR